MTSDEENDRRYDSNRMARLLRKLNGSNFTTDSFLSLSILISKFENSKNNFVRFSEFLKRILNKNSIKNLIFKLSQTEEFISSSFLNDLLNFYIDSFLAKNSDLETFLKVSHQLKEFNLIKKSKTLLEFFSNLEKRLKFETQYEPTFSWAMPRASFPGHPQVEEFLKDENRTTLEYKAFNGVNNARNFAATLSPIHINKFNNHINKFSVDVEVKGMDKNSSVIIVKNKKYFENKVAIYKRNCEELVKTLELVKDCE